MKKALRWFGLSLLILAGLLGLLAWDMVRRAKASIDAHEEKLTSDIRSLRARHAAWINPLGPAPRYDLLLGQCELQWHNLPTESDLAELRRHGVYYPYESAPRYLDWGNFPYAYQFKSPVSKLQWDEILAGLAMIQDSRRGGGLSRASRRASMESRLIDHVRVNLPALKGSPAELRGFAEKMDALDRSRPTIAEALDGEFALARARVLSVIRDRNNDHGYLEEPPGWTSLFFWRVHISRTLNQLAYVHWRLGELQRLPSADVYSQFKSLAAELSDERDWPPVVSELSHYDSIWEDELRCRDDWIMLRMAVAIVRFRAERGALPPALQDLVPEFLPAVPTSPLTEKEFAYDGVKLSGRASGSPWTFNPE